MSGGALEGEGADGLPVMCRNLPLSGRPATAVSLVSVDVAALSPGAGAALGGAARTLPQRSRPQISACSDLDMASAASPSSSGRRRRRRMSAGGLGEGWRAWWESHDFLPQDSRHRDGAGEGGPGAQQKSTLRARSFGDPCHWTS